MKLERAIEILTEWHWPDSTHPWNEMETAIKLGIEALRAVQRHRHDTMPAKGIVLKGETKE